MKQLQFRNVFFDIKNIFKNLSSVCVESDWDLHKHNTNISFKVFSSYIRKFLHQSGTSSQLGGSIRNQFISRGSIRQHFIARGSIRQQFISGKSIIARGLIRQKVNSQWFNLVYIQFIASRQFKNKFISRGSMGEQFIAKEQSISKIDSKIGVNQAESSFLRGQLGRQFIAQVNQVDSALLRQPFLIFLRNTYMYVEQLGHVCNFFLRVIWSP